MIFSKQGPTQTGKTLQIVMKALKSHHVRQVVVASNTGETALSLIEFLNRTAITDCQVTVVTHVQGFSEPGENEMNAEVRKKLQDQGCLVVTAAHALSGGERSFSNRFQGIGILEIIAQTLRLFSQGVKVAFEISLMAADAGALEYGQPVIAIGGSGRGADTAVMLTPSTSANLLETRIHEILCKPE